jgi:hypothetical protein
MSIKLPLCGAGSRCLSVIMTGAANGRVTWLIGSGRDIEGGGEIQGCRGAFGVAAGEYPTPASMHAY